MENVLIKRYIPILTGPRTPCRARTTLCSGGWHTCSRSTARPTDRLFAGGRPGYQESRLDQSARSHTGAIGIMQMLPATASDLNVGIDDIDQTSPTYRPA